MADIIIFKDDLFDIDGVLVKNHLMSETHQPWIEVTDYSFWQFWYGVATFYGEGYTRILSPLVGASNLDNIYIKWEEPGSAPVIILQLFFEDSLIYELTVNKVYGKEQYQIGYSDGLSFYPTIIATFEGYSIDGVFRFEFADSQCSLYIDDIPMPLLNGDPGFYTDMFDKIKVGFYNLYETSKINNFEAGTFTILPPLAPTNLISSCTLHTSPNLPMLPFPDFSFNPESGIIPLTVYFTDLSSGIIDSWFWEFGNGDTSTEQNPSYEYLEVGIYEIRLTVTNDYGSTQKSKFIFIYDSTNPPEFNPLFASFLSSVNFGLAPLFVDFTDTSSGLISSWSWLKDDIEFSTIQNPSYEFISIGVYEIKLIITDSFGSTSIAMQTILVVNDLDPNVNPPIADFSASTFFILPLLTVYFTDLSSGIIDSWFWEFGNGDTSTEQNPSYEYLEAGIYTVRLTVTNSYGSTSRSIQIIVSLVDGDWYNGPELNPLTNNPWKYIIDPINDVILMFDINNTYLGYFGGHGINNGEFDSAQRLCVTIDYVYVTDTTRVQQFDRNGNFIRVIGQEYLTHPYGIDSNGVYIYVSDIILHTIIIFDLNGVYRYEIHTDEEEIYAIAIDRNYIYALSKNHKRIIVYTLKGEFMYFIYHELNYAIWLRIINGILWTRDISGKIVGFDIRDNFGVTEQVKILTIANDIHGV